MSGCCFIALQIQLKISALFKLIRLTIIDCFLLYAVLQYWQSTFKCHSIHIAIFCCNNLDMLLVLDHSNDVIELKITDYKINRCN